MIKEAKNSFLFEVDVLRQGYQMDDPEQKTRFYQETAKKLLQFGEALERENYLQAVAREQMIPADELRGLVNRMGMGFGMKSGDSLGQGGKIRRRAEEEDMYPDYGYYESHDGPPEGYYDYGEAGPEGRGGYQDGGDARPRRPKSRIRRMASAVPSGFFSHG